MAAVDKWRTCLKEKSFSKKLRENNARESLKKVQNECKGLLAVNDNDLFIWDNHASHLIYFNLNNLSEPSPERESRFQILQVTDPPGYDVDWLVWNVTRTHLLLWGQLGISVIELPQKWGKYAEFQGGKDTVLCKCINIGEHYFSGHRGVRLLQVRWHPGSVTDSHLVFLTSDNLISIYDITDPQKPRQTIQLGDFEPSFSVSSTRPMFSSALGDNVVDFDFGPEVEVQARGQFNRTPNSDAPCLVWSVYCVCGNGDVHIAFTDLSSRPKNLPVQGPLLMHPPSEDNYGTDACAILCLPTTPPLVVITTCEGRLHHCLVLPRDMDETIAESASSYKSESLRTSAYIPPEEVMLYVYESVELELSLSTPSLGDSPTPEEIFTCPIRLIKDVANTERYHCCHGAGVHTVALPWIRTYQQFCTQDDEEEEMLPEHQDSIVEHLICTRPVPTSPASPILGLVVVRDAGIGSVMLTLSSDYDFHCLRLSDMRYNTQDTALVSTYRGRSIPSPLRKISREPFDDRIRRILQRNASNPLLKSRPNTEMSQQECFQLLSRATQVFREEYVQKQDLARQEIKRRVSILREQKDQQASDLELLQINQAYVSEGAERLAALCEECKERQEDNLKRVEIIMRKLQSRTPFLSEAERSMKKEMEDMEEKLETYKRSLEQLRVKRDYQQRQIEQNRRSNQPSPVIRKSQMSQLRDVLKQEGDDVADLLKKLNQLKVEASS